MLFLSRLGSNVMEQFLISTLTVTLAEIGDKTQLLSLFLILKYKKPFQIALGILLATILNHLATAYLGVAISDLFNSSYFQYFLTLSFVLLGIWLLFPDKEDDVDNRFDQFGIFAATCVLFFIAELGDKTQFATALLASQFQSIWLVTLGSTLGMLLANIPVLIFGEALIKKAPLKLFRALAAITAIAVGIAGFIL